MTLKCGCEDGTKEYNEKYDTYYCKKHNVWLEEKCPDPLCEYCSIRPNKPNEN